MRSCSVSLCWASWNSRGSGCDFERICKSLKSKKNVTEHETKGDAGGGLNKLLCSCKLHNNENGAIGILLLTCCDMEKSTYIYIE